MAHLYVNQELPTTSEQAIREFNDRYLAVVTAAQPSTWASQFVTGIGAPRITYPLSAFGAKFRETKTTDGRQKSMQEKSFDLKVVEFDEGFEAPVLDLLTNVFAYRNWSKTPEALALAEERHFAVNLAATLEGGTSVTSPWDGVDFFSASHLSNPFDSGSTTWSNYNNSGTDPAVIANLQTEMTAMRGVLDINGDKLNVEPQTILLPTGKYQVVNDLLNQERLASGASNPLRGQLKTVHVPELTDTNDWYLVDDSLIARGFDPLIGAKYVPGETLGLRIFDESSDFYKTTGKIKVSQHIWTGFSLVFPHAIRRIAGA